VTHVKARY